MHRMGSVSKSIVLIGSLRNIFEFAFMFGVEGVLGFSVREETVDSMYDIPVKEIDITETLALAKKREVFLVVCDANRERWNEIISSNQLKYQEQFLWFEDFFESLNRFHKESLGKRQIAIWGVGDTQVNLQRDLEKRYGEITISCYIDGNDDSTAGELNGRPVYHVSDISDISKYFIIVASVYYFEIKDRLQEMGLREDIDFLPFSAFKTNPREMMKTLVSAPQREEFYCTNPYTFFYYAWHDTYPCCSTWVRYPIGNPMTDPPEACWNSVVAKCSDFL